MTGKTNYWSQEVLNLLRNQAAPVQATWHIALFSVSPTDAYLAGGGEDGTEVTDTNTNRQAFAATNFVDPDGEPVTNPPGQETNNGVAISWTGWNSMQGTGPPHDLEDFGVLDSTFVTPTTSGELLYYGEIIPTRSIEQGETATFNIGDLIINED